MISRPASSSFQWVVKVGLLEFPVSHVLQPALEVFTPWKNRGLQRHGKMIPFLFGACIFSLGVFLHVFLVNHHFWCHGFSMAMPEGPGAVPRNPKWPAPQIDVTWPFQSDGSGTTSAPCLHFQRWIQVESKTPRFPPKVCKHHGLNWKHSPDEHEQIDDFWVGYLFGLYESHTQTYSFLTSWGSFPNKDSDEMSHESKNQDVFAQNIRDFRPSSLLSKSMCFNNVRHSSTHGLT